ncbi:long-chain-fatty-acyl-CoA reductase [Streptomyces sp. SLBN-118]|uniref:aldehyde dehydrogenase family protein n=1 Tax=Streptomyces sp. SLBN-118 TaxID=2768454 RepID=UPI00114E2ADE|nr:aldehyde dehydrogenase family protein [Streptomyces sp. SLBN-118]TQK50236.1 long-chain-fatty-acyl-CoA reductase [Streptomyces sp. SLBN-118]
MTGHVVLPAPTKVKTHPFMVWGERVEPDNDPRVLEFPNGARAAVPRLTRALVDRLHNPPTDLAETPLQEIVAYLNRIGHLWNNEEYARRRLYVRELKRMHGYSQQMADAEADLISATLRAHAQLHDMVAVELGHRQIMDRWIPREDAEVRAYPRGRSVHILPGNVPYSTTVSLIRALLTKNTSVLKYAAGEPATAVVLAQSFTDIDPNHPVTRSVSAVFWERDSDLGKEILGSADVICAWGGAEAVQVAYRNCSSEAIVVPYGPRRSFTVVGKDADMARATRGIAHDASMYEQRACFSTHQVFTDADPEEFADRLQAELVRYEDMLPRTSVTADEAAQASMEVAAQQFLGQRVRTGSWGSILITDPATVTELPSARTVFVHPVADLAEVSKWVDPTVQTIGLAPWSLHEQLRHELARRGACRFVEAGLSPFFRLGGSHDGLQPLQMMTRMVSVEAPRLNYGKGMVVPIDQSEFLEHRRLRDLLM